MATSVSTNPSSIESRARRLASKVSREQLLKHAEQLQKQRQPAAVVFWLALRVYDEDRSLMASIAGADYMGAAVYALRPNGRIPSDPVVVEQ
jgi:hypothetical protein